MFGGMKQKLQDMQQQMEQTKARLDTISVESKSSDEKVKVVVTASKKVVSVQIDQGVDMGSINETLKLVLNDALTQAEKVAEAEMQGVAQGIMPNMPDFLK